jgi:hypothetical protein
MTKNRDIAADRRNTEAVLALAVNGAKTGKLNQNWLGHTGGAAEIDALLLCGTTMPVMEKCRGAVEEHLKHLSTAHGLTVSRTNDGFYKLTVIPE